VMYVIFIASFCDLCNKPQRYPLAVWKLNRALASTKLCQPGGKMRNDFVTGIEPDVVLEGCEGDYVALFPVSGHSPLDSLLGVRHRRAERIPHLMKDWTNAFGLGFNVESIVLRGSPQECF